MKVTLKLKRNVQETVLLTIDATEIDEYLEAGRPAEEVMDSYLTEYLSEEEQWQQITDTANRADQSTALRGDWEVIVMSTPLGTLDVFGTYDCQTCGDNIEGRTEWEAEDSVDD